MIKKIIKYFLFIIVVVGLFLSFSDAGYVFKFNHTYSGPFDANYDINVFGKGIPLTSSLGYSKKMLYITNGRYMFWNENQLPYIYSNGIYGQINFYKTCPSLGGTGNPFGTSSCSSYPCSVNYGQNSCSQVNISSPTESKLIIGSFFSTLNQSSDYYYIHYVNNLTMFCFYSSSLDKIMCFFQPSSSNGTNYGSTFDGISSNLLFDPPSYTQGGGGNSGGSTSGNVVGLVPQSTGSAIEFYEDRYGFNKDICYVGVNNMTTLRGSSVSFNQGGGLTIFEAFESLYGNTDLDKVYVWINNWILNYEQWFGNDGDPMYLSTYNSGLNQVDLYYDNLTYPFAGQPVAVYFMASYIEQVFANTILDPSGSAVVSYCNLKINDGSYEEILDQSDKSAIENYVNKTNTNHGLNPDGTEKDYGAWLSSGVEIAFSGNTSIKDTLINFLDETEESIKSLKGNTGSIINGHILPSWLIGAFLFFALFKFIRKR